MDRGLDFNLLSLCSCTPTGGAGQFYGNNDFQGMNNDAKNPGAIQEAMMQLEKQQNLNVIMKNFDADDQ